MNNRNAEVSDLMEGLGMRIRTARVKQKMRLADVAQRAGYSTSFLSQVERGIANPSVGALKHIADALAVPVMDIFFSDDATDAGSQTPAPAPGRDAQAISPTLITRERRKAITYPQSSIRYELVVPHLQGALEVLWIEAPPGASTGQAYSHDAEECVLVIEGSMEITIAGARYDLSEGDSMVFSGDAPHSWRNSGSGPVAIVWVTTPPSF
jgi:transcriptional regulator with XRE-family HTH domain